MKAFYFPALLVALTLLFTQCKKDTSSTGNGDYSRLTTGSSWTYRYTEGTAAPATFKLTATSKDTTVTGGRVYKVLTSSDGARNSYLGKSGSDYYRFASFPSLGIDSFEELYLKDNVGVNGTWSGEATIVYMSASIKGNLAYTVKGKGESRTVLTNTFNNVVHVRLDITLPTFANINVGGGDFYYAEGVGLIESNILVTPPVFVGGTPYSSHQELVSYEIK